MGGRETEEQKWESGRKEAREGERGGRGRKYMYGWTEVSKGKEHERERG